MDKQIEQVNETKTVTSTTAQTNIVEGGIRIEVTIMQNNIQTNDADKERAFRLGYLARALSNCPLDIMHNGKSVGREDWQTVATHGTAAEQEQLIQTAQSLVDEIDAEPKAKDT